MPVPNSIADMADEVAAWRHDIHRHPEIQYDVHRTAAVVAERLRSFGVDEVVESIGRTGVVGVIRGRPGSRRIALRADMDALPITEETGVPYASTTPGAMHACGHDGHTAMLLGAAKHLAETRNFAGDAILVFQPAEEGGAGAKAMMDDGLFERFGVQEVYGLHNMPGLPPGTFSTRPGPIMASSDTFQIVIRGRGAHAAKPHEGIDPVVIAAQIIMALQTIPSRNVDPLLGAVVSVTGLEAGQASNIINQTCRIWGTCRALDADTRDLIERRLVEVAEHTARAFGATADAVYTRGYPVTRNHPDETAFAVEAAGAVVGPEAVSASDPPIMGGEDFSFMLEGRPGAFMFIGNGDSAGLHHPAYDFNDSIIPAGIAYWTRLAEARLTG